MLVVADFPIGHSQVGLLRFNEKSVVMTHIRWTSILGISASHMGFSTRLGNVSEIDTAVMIGVDMGPCEIL